MTMPLGRREFLAVLAGAMAVRPLAASAQGAGGKRPLIAWLSGGTSEVIGPFAADFRDGMRELGYVEGRGFDMLSRYAEGFLDRLPALAAELVRAKPDIILAAAVSAAVPARHATSTIPIVCPALADAVHLGLIASEARPGGNVTGIEPYVAGLPAKQMEFAHAMVPGALKVGLLTNLRDPKAGPQRQELEGAARELGLSVVAADANRPEEVGGALETLADQRVDVVIVLQTTLLLTQGRQIAGMALAKRLPTVYGYREHVVAGGLISYGVDLRWCYRRGAVFVDKILRGAQPGDLPVEFPTKMMLTVNLKTARALGITVPPALSSLADEEIE